MTDEEFFSRVRIDAAPLRYEPDPFAMARIRAGVRERLLRPTVTQLLARWFRPITATLAIIALAAGIGFATIEKNNNDNASMADSSVEIVMAGDSYSVGQ